MLLTDSQATDGEEEKGQDQPESERTETTAPRWKCQQERGIFNLCNSCGYYSRLQLIDLSIAGLS